MKKWSKWRLLDSAADNAATARDANNQAIYGIARPANLLDMDSEQVEKIKGTFNNVLDICGIQPGKKCDPEKSTMRYILIMTDGDVDGDSICNSVVCLMAKHCKPMIDAGMVGRILPPAYSIPAGKGKKVYVRSQREFFDKVLKKFLDDTEVTYKGRKLSKKELREKKEKKKYPSVAYEVAERIQKRTDQEVRITVPGHMQRGGSPCPYDRVLSTRFGAAAAEAILDGDFGNMVGLKNGNIVRVPLAEVAGKLKYVDPESEIIEEARMTGISFGDR